MTTRAAGRTLAAVVMCLGVIASGCARRSAAAIPEGPPLAMPAPPQRVLAPLEEEPLAAAPGSPETPAAEAPQIPPSRPPARRATPAADADSRQEPPPTATAAPAPPENPRELRVEPRPGEQPANQEKVRGLIDQATRDLGRVNGQRLTSNRGELYKSAQRYLKQAQDFLNEGNVVGAQAAAEKAVQLATELARP